MERLPSNAEVKPFCGHATRTDSRSQSVYTLFLKHRQGIPPSYDERHLSAQILLTAVSMAEAFHTHGCMGHNDLLPGNVLYTVDHDQRFLCCYTIDFGHAVVYKSAQGVRTFSSDLRNLASLCSNLLEISNRWERCRTLADLSDLIKKWLLHHQQVDHVVIIKNAAGQDVPGKAGG
jgi:hypothetical protein